MESITQKTHQVIEWLSLDRARLSGLVAVAVGIVPVAVWARRSYLVFLSLGPGGLPYNIFGWIIQGLLQPFGRSDTKVPAPYKRDAIKGPYGAQGGASFLGDEGKALPVRRPPRPTVPGLVAPQRQTTDAAPQRYPAMNSFLREVAQLNPSLLSIKPSGFEHPSHDAIHLRESETHVVPEYLKQMKGEIAHVHPEASTHIVLSLADAETVIEKGWGERHKLSGVRGFIPWSFVLIYAPRDDEEVKTWKDIVTAGIECAVTCGGLDGADTAVQTPATL